MKTRTKHLMWFTIASLTLLWGLIGLAFYFTPKYLALYWFLGAFWTIASIIIAIDETSKL